MEIDLGELLSSSVKQVGFLKLIYFEVKLEAIEYVTYRWIGGHDVGAKVLAEVVAIVYELLHIER